jgi:hypothetical protein
MIAPRNRRPGRGPWADRESAPRVMHWLENEGIIAIGRGKTLVRDAVALTQQLR